MKRHLLSLVAALLAAVTLMALAASTALAAENEFDDVESRYQTLEELAGASEEEEGVVVETRVGVLTAVNRALNGAIVSFEGEAIGDILNADEGHKWVNVLGSDGAEIGVYMTDEQACQIDALGNYNQTGSTLYVEGIYSVACDDHQGELDVHASRVEVVEEGQLLEHNPRWYALPVAVALIVIAAGLIALFFGLRHVRQRKEKEASKWH